MPGFHPPHLPPQSFCADALKFNGPAPEVINSRLAMMGLIAVAIRESETGLTAMQQLTSPEVGMPLLAVLFVYASLVPILAGAKMEPFGERELHLSSGVDAFVSFVWPLLVSISQLLFSTSLAWLACVGVARSRNLVYLLSTKRCL